MTDKERLENIKNGFGAMKYLHLDIRWLIEQAEQVEVLQANLNGTIEVLDETIVSLQGIAEGNIKLREALEFYANESNYDVTQKANPQLLRESKFNLPEVIEDLGEVARQALDK